MLRTFSILLLPALRDQRHECGVFENHACYSVTQAFGAVYWIEMLYPHHSSLHYVVFKLLKLCVCITYGGLVSYNPMVFFSAGLLIGSRLTTNKWVVDDKRPSSYRGADKSLPRPGRKTSSEACQGRARFQQHRDASCQVFFFLQGKAPKEIHAILTETLACFLPGRAKDISATLYIEISNSNKSC